MQPTLCDSVNHHRRAAAGTNTLALEDLALCVASASGPNGSNTIPATMLLSHSSCRRPAADIQWHSQQAVAFLLDCQNELALRRP